MATDLPSSLGVNETPARTASLEGYTLGKYRILEPLGQGGMARIYRAYHPHLERYVAIKMLRADLVDDPGFLDRFRREAQARLRCAIPTSSRSTTSISRTISTTW